MKKTIWKVRHCYYFCKALKTVKFWELWWLGDAALENNPDCLDDHPADAVSEELSNWTD